MAIDVDNIGLDDGTELYRLLRPYVEVLLQQAWTDNAAALGYGWPFDLRNAGVQEVLDQLVVRVQGVAETTREEIRMLVGRQAEEGWSVDRLAAALREKRDLQTKGRAEMIAVTETANAYTQGSLVLYAETGMVSEIEWLDADGCDICAPLNGTRVPLGESFPGGVMVPAHPNCRCAIAPVV